MPLEPLLLLVQPAPAQRAWHSVPAQLRGFDPLRSRVQNAQHLQAAPASIARSHQARESHPSQPAAEQQEQGARRPLGSEQRTAYSQGLRHAHATPAVRGPPAALPAPEREPVVPAQPWVTRPTARMVESEELASGCVGPRGQPCPQLVLDLAPSPGLLAPRLPGQQRVRATDAWSVAHPNRRREQGLTHRTPNSTAPPAQDCSLRTPT